MVWYLGSEPVHAQYATAWASSSTAARLRLGMKPGHFNRDHGLLEVIRFATWLITPGVNGGLWMAVALQSPNVRRAQAAPHLYLATSTTLPQLDVMHLPRMAQRLTQQLDEHAPRHKPPCVACEKRRPRAHQHGTTAAAKQPITDGISQGAWPWQTLYWLLLPLPGQKPALQTSVAPGRSTSASSGCP
jgi:hypothetical protein